MGILILQRRPCISLLLTMMFVTLPSEVSSDSLTIAAFNIQVFGQSKISKQEVVSILVQIIKRYDIILIQEIRDSAETAIYTLLDEVNLEGDTYEMVISERLGRTSSKEQYAYMYKSNMGIEVLNIHQHEDPADWYEREPYSVQFQIQGSAIPDFVLMGIHIKPDDAVAELDYLVNATEHIKALWNTDHVMILGDLNADCSYVSQTAMSSLLLRDEQFTWWIDDQADTTVSNSDCSYDRFISTGDQFTSTVINDSVTVFRFDTEYGLNDTFARDVSDHYPIELQLYLETAQTNTESYNITSTGQADNSESSNDTTTAVDPSETDTDRSSAACQCRHVYVQVVLLAWVISVGIMKNEI